MHKKTIIELHNALINNEINVSELNLSATKHINEINGKLNAVTSLIKTNNVNNAESLLANIPYACKDLIATKGLVTANASAFLEDFVPVYNATILDRLNCNGANLLAKTNMDEFGMGGLNINTVIGPSHNPYDTSRSTGGSSGGSAALVAAGCVPYAIGTDTGDSVRRPAAFCGIYGFKPTWGVISRYGIFPYASSLDQAGVFTRSIEDMALVVQEINGYDARDAATYNHKKEMFFNKLDGSRKLKIAYIKELNDTFTCQDVINNFEQTKSYLESCNHTVSEVHVSQDLLKLISPIYQVISNVEASSNLGNISGVAFGKRIVKDDVNSSIIASRSNGLSKYTKVRIALGAICIKEANKERYYYKAKQGRQLLIEAMDKIYEDFDLIISPSTNCAALKDQVKHNDAFEVDHLINSNHLGLANLIGAPSINIPTHFNDGLPYGLSAMAKPFNDQIVLDFAKGFEDGLRENSYQDLVSFYNRYVEEVK